jgi:hypothetical protein
LIQEDSWEGASQLLVVLGASQLAGGRHTLLLQQVASAAALGTCSGWN